MDRLPETEIARGLERLEGWGRTEDGAIGKQFVFADFVAAFGFMTRVALLAEKAGHHPDWSNSYKAVTITLSTHDAGGVTQADLDLAEAIDAVA